MGKKQNGKMSAKANKKAGKSLAEKTEQILLTMPKIIASQISKDLLLLKKQQSKLKDDLRKADTKKQQLQQQQQMLKKKMTPAARKKIAALQKESQKSVKLLTTLKHGMSLVNKQAAELSQKKEKYTALQMQLGKFQKEWAKKPLKKTVTVKKKKIKAKTRKEADLHSSFKEELSKMLFQRSDKDNFETREIPMREMEEMEEKIS